MPSGVTVATTWVPRYTLLCIRPALSLINNHYKISSTDSDYYYVVVTVALRRGGQRHACVHDRSRWWRDTDSRRPDSQHARRDAPGGVCGKTDVVS